MKANECRAWVFKTEPTDESEIKCPNCDEWSPLAEWTEGYAYCEDCGDHAAMVCPKCYDPHDHVWSDLTPLEVR